MKTGSEKERDPEEPGYEPSEWMCLLMCLGWTLFCFLCGALVLAALGWEWMVQQFSGKGRRRDEPSATSRKSSNENPYTFTGSPW